MTIYTEWITEQGEKQKHNEVVNNLTGGNSYSVVHLGIRNDIIYPTIIVEGDYPMQDVTINLVDASKYPDGFRSRESLTKATDFRLGTLYPNRAGELSDIVTLRLDQLDKYEYTFDTYSRNNHTFQTFKLQRQSDGWAVAERLVDFDDKKLIYEKIDSTYVGEKPIF